MILNTLQERREAIYEPAELRPGFEDTMLVLPNSQGAGLADYHGQLAKSVAEYTGVRVLAFERPFSADQAVMWGLRRRITAGYPSIVAHTTEHLNGIIEQEGVERAITVGHSAAGLFALYMAHTGLMPVDSVIATDPPAVRYSHVPAAEIGYGIYELHTERQKPKDDLPPNAEPQQTPTGQETVQRHLAEIMEYSAVYSRSRMYGAQALIGIARKQPCVGVDVFFPEHTYTGKPDYLRYLVNESKRWSEDRQTDPAAKPFNVSVIPGIYHSHFSNNHYFSELVNTVLAERDTPRP